MRRKCNRKVELFKFRNYDSATGTARKHARTDEGETVEAAVEGLTEKVLEEDKARRAQELVRRNYLFVLRVEERGFEDRGGEGWCG